MTNVTVHQITQRSRGKNEAYLNIDIGESHVSVWTSCYSQSTYLIQVGIQIRLIQFESQARADEWLAGRENIERQKITKLEQI